MLHRAVITYDGHYENVRPDEYKPPLLSTLLFLFLLYRIVRFPAADAM